MINIIFKRSLIATAALFAVAVVASASVSAQPARAQETQTQTQEQIETAEQTTQQDQSIQTQGQERREAGQGRLEAAKLKVCEKRQKAITNIMVRIGDRGQKQLDLFTKIADRTVAFYADKGKTLSNYQALVDDVLVKKAIAQEAVDTIKNSSTTFDCNGEDPKGVVHAFKASLKAEIEALKAYKTSVKNLIVGVKSVQGTTTSSENGGQQ